MSEKKRTYTGKKVDEEVFYDCLNAFVIGEMTIPEACKAIGLSRPTLTKRWNAVLLGDDIPREDWFHGIRETDTSV